MAWRKPQNFREWLRIIFRHRKKFFFPAVTVMIIVVLASNSLPRTYSAEAKFQRFNDQTLSMVNNKSIQMTLASVRRTLWEEIKGRPAIEQLVEDLQLTRGFPRQPDGELTTQGTRMKLALVQQIQGSIGIGFDINSEAMDQIRVSFRGEDRDLVPRVANRIVESYISRTRQQLDEMLLSAKTFFQKEVDTQRKQVADLSRKKLEFEIRYPDVDPDNPLSVQNRTIELTSRQSALASRLDEAMSKKAELEEFLLRVPQIIKSNTIMRNPEYDALVARKSELESELERQKYEYRRTDEHPQIIALKRRIADLTAKMDETQQSVNSNVVEVFNPARLEFEEKSHALEGEIKSLKNQMVAVSKSLEQFEDLRRNFFKIRDDYTNIQTDLSEAQTRLRFWDQNLRTTITAWTIEQQNAGVRIRMWQRAPDSSRPSSPDMVRIFGVAMAMGLGVGVVMVLAAELLDHSFRSVEHAVDELKLPVFGTVNEIVTPEFAFRRKVLNMGLYPAIGGVMLLILLISLAAANLSLTKPEQFDQLKASPLQYIKNTLSGK